jgi:hypothetical protein
VVGGDAWSARHGLRTSRAAKAKVLHIDKHFTSCLHGCCVGLYTKAEYFSWAKEADTIQRFYPVLHRLLGASSATGEYSTPFGLSFPGTPGVPTIAPSSSEDDDDDDEEGKAVSDGNSASPRPPSTIPIPSTPVLEEDADPSAAVTPSSASSKESATPSVKATPQVKRRTKTRQRGTPRSRRTDPEVLMQMHDLNTNARLYREDMVKVTKDVANSVSRLAAAFCFATEQRYGEIPELSNKKQPDDHDVSGISDLSDEEAVLL